MEPRLPEQATKIRRRTQSRAFSYSLRKHALTPSTALHGAELCFAERARAASRPHMPGGAAGPDLLCSYLGMPKSRALASNKLIASEESMSVADQTMPGQKSVPALADTIAELYAKSGAAEFAFAPEQFLQLLKDVALKHASSETLEQYCLTLRVEDLILARACAAGNERAWEVFMLRFREKLY